MYRYLLHQQTLQVTRHNVPPPGVTLTRVGAPPAGVTWYWQTVAGGTSTANSATTFVATTGGTYYLRAQNNTTGCWSAGSGSVAITVTPSLSAIAGTPAPTNAATGICYAGGSPLTSLTWNAVAGATSYDVYFGAGSLPGTAIANVATNSYTLGTLSASTTYYWQVVPRNACGATTGTPATWTFTTAAAPCVCVPTSANNTYPISNVTFAGINNNSSATVTAGPDYQDFSGIFGNVTAGSTYNISVTSTGAGGTNTFYQYVYFDWNNNGNFADDGGPYNLGNYTTATATFNLNITIPVTATIGTIKFRVVNSFNSILNPCATTGYFQMEDYSVTILAAPPCTEPTAQPTALVLTAGTPSGTALNGSFTAASPAPQNYLVVMNTTGTAPTSLIMDGTTYPIGSSIGVGNTVVDSDSNTTFTATGLNPSTTYYFYIYSLNALCTGGPLYNTNPTVLIGNATTSTGAPTYCTPDTTLGQNDNKYINRVAFIGTLVETNNTSTYSNATPGYQDFTGLAVKAQQAQGEGVNMIVESLGGRTRLHAWVDWNKNGTFESSEMVYGPATAGISSTFGFIVPSGAVPGDYRIRVRTYNSGSTLATENFGLNFDACQPFTTLSGEPQYGEAEDYLFTVIQRCDANIVSVTEGQVCNSGTVTLSATGTAGTTNYRWYASASGGAQLPGSPTTGSWTTPSISTTTTYYVTAWNGTCESLVRTPVVANVNTTPTLTFTPSTPETCGENNIISITATGDKELSTLLFENFESGGLGAFTNVNSDPSPANVKNDTRWTNRSSTFVPAVGISWKPAISSGLAPNNFALATSDSGTAPETLVENSLISGTLNSTGYLNLTMTMKFYYSRYFPDGTTTADEFVSIQISQTGGAPWTTLQTFTADTGIGTKFADLTYNLNGYINQTNLRIRILHHSLGSTTGWLPDGVAVDDIKIFGEVPLGTSFNWTSVLPVDAYQDALCTVPYISGSPAVMVYIKPTLAQLELTTYSFTASALLSNGCSASNLVSIDNKSKVWKGGTNGDWNNPNNWSPVGVPDATTCVIIPPAANNSNVLGTNYNGFGKTLQVVNGGSLTVHPSNTLTITDFVEVSGATSIFNIENSGSLIQVNNVANSGNISMKRNVSIEALDYVYWSSPVANFTSSAISPATPTSVIWKWAPTLASTVNNHGNWLGGSETMVNGKGYIVRSPNGWPTTTATFTANFVGVPNNGIINMPISRGAYDLAGTYNTLVSTTPGTRDDDNWNLIGNPYPSAISANTFLATNTNIDGNIRYWTHGTIPSSAISDPFYNNYVQNYTVGDYVIYNATGANPPIGSGNIAAGQGFFVLMNHSSAATTENVVFNNNMRRNDYRNDLFFRNSNETLAGEVEDEKNRIWLNLISPSATSSTALIGYVYGATNQLDRMYDASALDVKTNFELYSFSNTDKLNIQGKALPFNNEDIIPLGIKIAQNGIHTLGISTVDGLFSDASQNIYLEDTVLGITHDLRAAPYSFTGTVGSNDTRFVLKFNNSALGNEDFTANAVTVFTNESINVNTTNQTIKSVRVYDLLGRVLGTFNNVDATAFSTKNVAKTQSPLLVEVTLSNGTVVSKKTIY